MNPVDLKLYLVTDSGYYDEKRFLDMVEKACRGGVTLLQLREKNRGGREYLRLAQAVKEITDPAGVPLIIDDRGGRSPGLRRGGRPRGPDRPACLGGPAAHGSGQDRGCYRQDGAPGSGGL